MKNKKIYAVRFHLGVQYFYATTTGLNMDKKDLELTLTPLGVFIRGYNPASSKTKVFETLVPFSNIQQIIYTKNE